MRLLVMFCVYRLLKNFKYKIQISDLIVLTLDIMIVLVMFFISLYLFFNLDTIMLHTLYAITMMLGLVFMKHFLYPKNMFPLREQEQKDKMQIAHLHHQHLYYKEKRKAEERVHGIYHDMKNHLLYWNAVKIRI